MVTVILGLCFSTQLNDAYVPIQCFLFAHGKYWHSFVSVLSDDFVEKQSAPEYLQYFSGIHSSDRTQSKAWHIVKR